MRGLVHGAGRRAGGGAAIRAWMLAGAAVGLAAAAWSPPARRWYLTGS
jgi:hypothetical protein